MGDGPQIYCPLNEEEDDKLINQVFVGEIMWKPG